jgi:hypothetical protein
MEEMAKPGERKKIEQGIWRSASGTYMVRFYDPDGRERAKSFLKLADARNFKAEVRIDKHRGEFIDPRNPKTPFPKWAEKYLDQKLALRPRTRDKYESALRLHLLPAFADRSIGAITPEDVQSWVVTLTRSNYQTDRSYGAESIRGYYDLFASIMRLAVDRGLIAKTPCRGIELPTVLRKNSAISPNERSNVSSMRPKRVTERSSTRPPTWGCGGKRPLVFGDRTSVCNRVAWQRCEWCPPSSVRTAVIRSSSMERPKLLAEP